MFLRRRLPAINSQSRTDLAVLLPYNLSRAGMPDPIGFCRWLSGGGALLLWLFVGLAALLPMLAYAQQPFSIVDGFWALSRWLPLLLKEGFVLNILISFFTMFFGTIFGVILGLGQISLFSPIRWFCYCVTQLFRNSPWLVLLFIVILAFPFEVNFFGFVVPIPDWMKAVFGLTLPIMANISEIVRGAINSVPSGQWEAAESLAFSRVRTLFEIILPQCIKRMLPAWMNWYAILTMATPLVSLLGVEELVTLSRQAMEAEDNHPSLLVPFYGFALLVFFIYCYPIARFTVHLEKRFQVKL